MMHFFKLTEINDALRTDPKAFLDQCDAQYQAKIESAANLIIHEKIGDVFSQI